jgi:hypothetical protein
LVELARATPDSKKLKQVFSMRRLIQSLRISEPDERQAPSDEPEGRSGERELEKESSLRAEAKEPARDEDQAAAVLKVIEVLDRLKISYLVGGSFASSLYGISRYTADADILAALKRKHAGQIAAELDGEFYVSERAILRAADSKRSFNLIHLETAFKIDVFVAKEGGFAESQLARRRLVSLTPNAQVYFASAEDTVLAKLDWYRRGKEVSDQQWRDVLAVIKVQKGRLELEYMRRWAEELKISDLLEEVMREAGMTE